MVGAVLVNVVPVGVYDVRSCADDCPLRVLSCLLLLPTRYLTVVEIRFICVKICTFLGNS